MVTKRERSNTAKLAVFKSVFFPILACGHESCVTTGSAISSTSGRDGIFAKSSRCYTHDKVCSCEIRKALNVEPPVIWIERYLLRWFCHVTRIPRKDGRGKSCWLHPREIGPEVDQVPSGVVTSPTLLGPVVVWTIRDCCWPLRGVSGLPSGCCRENPPEKMRVKTTEETRLYGRKP